jgi:uncharacterized protein DUF2017
MSVEPFAPVDGGIEVRLSLRVRAILAELCEGLDHLLTTEHPASDPAMARLFPAAYPDDPLRELEFEQLNADDLVKGRLESLERMRATMHEDVLHNEDALAWLRTLNDVRLVLGGRLELTEESRADDFTDDEAAADGFSLYGLLTELQAMLLLALDPEAVEPEP